MISFQGSENVQRVFIDVDESEGKPTITQMDQSSDHSVECSGGINIYGNCNVMPKIKGRGNATWSSAIDKKPYNITLDSKIKFPSVDSTKTKKWSFLCEVTDHSLLVYYATGLVTIWPMRWALVRILPLLMSGIIIRNQVFLVVGILSLP